MEDMKEGLWSRWGNVDGQVDTWRAKIRIADDFLG